jgi:hypothetical protein
MRTAALHAIELHHEPRSPTRERRSSRRRWSPNRRPPRPTTERGTVTNEETIQQMTERILAAQLDGVRGPHRTDAARDIVGTGAGGVDAFGQQLRLAIGLAKQKERQKMELNSPSRASHTVSVSLMRPEIVTSRTERPGRVVSAPDVDLLSPGRPSARRGRNPSRRSKPGNGYGTGPHRRTLVRGSAPGFRPAAA